MKKGNDFHKLLIFNNIKILEKSLKKVCRNQKSPYLCVTKPKNMTLKQINSKLKKAYTGNDWMYEYSLDLVSKQKTLCYGITFKVINDCVVFFKNDLYLGPYSIESVLEWNDSICLYRDKSNEINLEYLFILWLKKYILENNEN